MATIALGAAIYYGGTHEVKDYQEGVSQTYKAGQFVQIQASTGQIIECADDTTGIVGMAVKDATGTTGAKCPVLLCKIDTKFKMNFYDSTAGDAITVQTDVGKAFGLEVDSNKCYVDHDSGTNVVFIIDDLFSNLSSVETVGDTYGHVIVRVNPTYNQAAGLCVSI